MSEPANLEEKETQRIEAFSDGVFAIAITLLVLQLHVPKPQELDGQSLLSVLLHDWHYHVALVISFATILIMWFNHHKLFTYIHRTDHLFPYVNGLLLLTVTIVPWPTALVAAYWGDPQEETAAMVYCGANVMLALAFNILWSYATHEGRLLRRNVDRDQVARITHQYRLGPLLYLIALGLACWDATPGILVCLGLAVFFGLTGVIDTRKLKIPRSRLTT